MFLRLQCLHTQLKVSSLADLYFNFNGLNSLSPGNGTSRGRNGLSKSHKTEFREPSRRTVVEGVWKSKYLYTFTRLFPEIQAKCFSYNIILSEADKVIRCLPQRRLRKTSSIWYIPSDRIINSDLWRSVTCRAGVKGFNCSVPLQVSQLQQLLQSSSYVLKGYKLPLV